MSALKSGVRSQESEVRIFREGVPHPFRPLRVATSPKRTLLLLASDF